MQGRDSADIPLLGCSMRIHVPRCFTMEEKQRPPPPQPGRRHGTERHVGSAVERLRACLGCEGGGGDGVRQWCVCVFMSEIIWASKGKCMSHFFFYIWQHLKEKKIKMLKCRWGCALNVSACVEGEGLWGVTLQQRRAELGSFKLDLDSPGDTPHRISPLGQTWTRRSSLTLARFDRQKMGEHFPNGAGMRPPSTNLLPPPPPHSTSRHPSPSPANPTQLTKNGLGGTWRWWGEREEGVPFVCLWGWTRLPRSHASVLLCPRKHQLMPPSPRFWQITTNLTGRLNHYKLMAILEVPSSISCLISLLQPHRQLKIFPPWKQLTKPQTAAAAMNPISMNGNEHVKPAVRPEEQIRGRMKVGAPHPRLSPLALDSTWWKLETMATGAYTRVS